MKIYCLYFSLLFTTTFLSHGQEYEKVVGAWNALFLNNKLGEQFYITTELHHRTVNGFENLDQQIFRPSLNYKSPSGMQWTVGYSYLRNFTWGGEIKSEFFKEHNVWEQFQFSITGKKGGSFANQLRLEHRFIEKRNGSKHISFSSRIRYRFTYAYPLLKGSLAEKLKFVFYDEIFLILNPQGIPFAFNQNWTFFGINAKLSNKASLLTGFQKNTVARGEVRYLKNRFLNTILRYTF